MVFRLGETKQPAQPQNLARPCLELGFIANGQGYKLTTDKSVHLSMIVCDFLVRIGITP